MKKGDQLIGLLAVLLIVSCSISADACTGLQVKATDGSVVPARTLEFAIPLHSNVIVVPRGYGMVGTLPDGKRGLKWTSKYAFIGANAGGQPVILDGFNEKGLYFGLFYFPALADFPKLTAENAPRAIAAYQFGNWLLSNFATVEEARAALEAIVPVAIPGGLGGIGSTSYHFWISDTSGNGIVVEPIGGKLLVHENTLGVMTNAPTYDWHMTNIRNYVNLNAIGPAPLKLGADTFQALSQGSGLHGIPGDFTSPSRFLRAAFFVSLLPKVKSGDEAVFQAFHLLNNFDIPKGASETVKDGKKSYDTTQWSSANDLAKKRYYFRTYQDYGVRVIDLMKLDLNAKEIKTIKMDGVQSAVDVTDTTK
jgi:choloylglycine hydrolase